VPELDVLRFDYRLTDNFLSASEQSFFQVLKTCVPTGVHITTKVRLADLFYVPRSAEKRQGQINKIDRKHVDFLLCDAATMRPLVAIELDDSSHQAENRIERDIFVDEVFRKADFPLIHFQAKRGYNPNEISARLGSYLGASPIPSAPVQMAPVRRQSATEPPLCPKCGSRMVLRTIKSGERAGQQLYGCSNYPQCRGVINLV
jgi:predicted RNA-binding Zn-ribbon protein involved in translation (DUF1610 family)